ncbi:MAG: DUF559 domain-containing protein [Mycobacteriaceae bacterium]|nr:DUF559 domain-containing protein [Mycobacteriaceae bacterium]
MNMEPFLGTEAVAAGRFTRRTLTSRNVKIYQNVYLPKGVELTAEMRAIAAWLWSSRHATVAGLSAAALHRSKWIDAGLPAELIRPVPCKVNGIVIHRDVLDESEICAVRGMTATTPARTAYDLGRRGTLMQAVMRLDALANATGLKSEEVAALLPMHRGARGVPQLRKATDLMDGGSESPQETRTRLLLIAAGFPRPDTQIVVCNTFGEFIGRVDLGYRKWKVAVEYDGPQHWDGPEAHARDIERIADLEAEGWKVIRLSRDILRYRRSTFLVRVRDAMRDRGWPDHAAVRLDATCDM